MFGPSAAGNQEMDLDLQEELDYKEMIKTMKEKGLREDPRDAFKRFGMYVFDFQLPKSNASMDMPFAYHV